MHEAGFLNEFGRDACFHEARDIGAGIVGDGVAFGGNGHGGGEACEGGIGQRGPSGVVLGRDAIFGADGLVEDHIVAAEHRGV